jgi:hypothetical protein
MAPVRIGNGGSPQRGPRGSGRHAASNTVGVRQALVAGGMRMQSSQSGRLDVSPHRVFGPVRVLKHAVHDLDAWLEHFIALGIGPWWVSRNQSPETFIHRGTQSDTKFSWGLTWSGDVMYELIQPLDDLPSPYREFLDAGREGLQHGAFYPLDFDAAIAGLRESGKSPILEGHSGDAKFMYFEGLGSPPEPIELQYLPEEVIVKHRALKSICDNWDGSEPLRGPPRKWW